ncbi:MAG: TIM barrel protein [Bryobacteraceae bacterium]
MMHSLPAIHNAMWPGLVGKGPDSEPPIDLETMLNLTAGAEVDGVKFDGVDLFLAEPHTDGNAEALAELVSSKGLLVGSLVAPVWAATGGGSAMGSEAERGAFLTQVKKACLIGKRLRQLKIRPTGVVRIDSACSVEEWLKDPEENTKRIAQTFREACSIAEDYGERLAAEGEICWGGMHSWRRNLQLLEMVGRPETLGFQADMAHTMLFTMGHNAPEDRVDGVLELAYAEVASALRPWTIDFHVAQNDGTVKGAGSHDNTGRHCLPYDAEGKLDIVRDAGVWLRDDNGHLTKAIRHICWDGCMFPNAVMMDPATWNDVLKVMIAVRDAHGWD